MFAEITGPHTDAVLSKLSRRQVVSSTSCPVDKLSRRKEMISMKIAFLQSKESLPEIFSQKALDRIGKFGEVVSNDGDSSAGQVRKIIKGADIAVTSWGNGLLTGDILDQAPDLKLIVHAAGSVKVIVTDEVWKRGIRVTSSAKPLGQGVAETALGFTISASKNFYNLSSSLHDGKWNDCPRADVTELYGVTVGVIGAGWAGGHYIRLLKGFDVDVLLYDPYVSAERAEKMGARKTSLEELLRESDVVSIHAPSIPETKGMINARTLGLMKKDAVLINTARGSIVNECDLYRHMSAGNLKYACLDVFDPEPPAADHPLRTLPNAILTPHIAGLLNNGKHRIGMHVADEIEKFLRGEPMACEVTKEQLSKMA